MSDVQASNQKDAPENPCEFRSRLGVALDIPWARRRAAVAVSCAIVVLVVGVRAAHAQHGKVDRLILNNGDTLTCEILSLNRARLEVKTDAFGTISIEWPKVTSVTSPARYEVELSSGLRYYGALSTPSPGQIRVGADAPVPFADVVRFAPLESRFWRRLDGSVSLGFSYTQANERTQWSLDSVVRARTPKFVTEIAFDSLIASEDDAIAENRETLTTGVQRALRDRWYLSALGQFSQNETLGLSFRSVTGGGAGRWLVQSNTVLVAIYSGLAYTWERYTEREREQRAEFLTGVRWDWFTSGDHEFDLSIGTLSFVDIARDQRIRAEGDVTFSWKIYKDLRWNLSIFESFNSAPPSGEKKNDFGVTAALAWSF